jgi:hypothetical protein
MKTTAIITTIIASVLYLITTSALINDPIGRSTKEGVHFINFLFCYSLPILLWVIYFLNSNKKQPNKK